MHNLVFIPKQYNMYKGEQHYAVLALKESGTHCCIIEKAMKK